MVVVDDGQERQAMMMRRYRTRLTLRMIPEAERCVTQEMTCTFVAMRPDEIAVAADWAAAEGRIPGLAMRRASLPSIPMAF